MSALYGWHITSGKSMSNGRVMPRKGEWFTVFPDESIIHDGNIEARGRPFYFCEKALSALGWADAAEPVAQLNRVEVRGVLKNDPSGRGFAREWRVLWSVPSRDFAEILRRFAWACAWRAIWDTGPDTPRFARSSIAFAWENNAIFASYSGRQAAGQKALALAEGEERWPAPWTDAAKILEESICMTAIAAEADVQENLLLAGILAAGYEVQP